MTIHDLCTPALILDLTAFETNLARMASHARQAGVNLRPHTKSHKCPAIARRQLEAGAVGVCAATLREAEVMAEAGIPQILITSELVGEPKIKRFMELLQRHPGILAVVDDAQNVAELGQAVEANKLQLEVLIDLDVGTHRTGIAPGMAAVELAQVIARRRGLKLRGLQAYAGHASHTAGFENRRAVSEQAMTHALETQKLLRQNGFEAALVSGGSTGTYNIDSRLPGISELQVGSYVFMDLDYRCIGGAGGPLYDDFQCALTVLSTVISCPSPAVAIVDAGLKAFSTDKPFSPECKDVCGVRYSWGGDEHGKLDLSAAARPVRLGERLEFIIPHCDPTVNLYDRLYALREEKVEAVWPIAGRGY